MNTLIINYQIIDDKGVIIEEQNLVIDATEETILKLKQLTELK